MRVVVDALGVDGGGGLLTAVRNMVTSWATVAPDDEVVVVASRRAGPLLPGPAPGREVVLVDLGPQRQVGRLVRGAWAVRHQARTADVVLATLPLLPSFGVGEVPCVAVVYDMRHRLRPTDFTRVQVAQRTALYHHAVRRAGHLVVTSRRTESDLDALFRRHAPVTVVHLGSDHVPPAAAPGRRLHGLVPGHFSNKGVDLALAAWASVGERTGSARPLLVTGVGDADRPRWAAAADRLGIGDQVSIAPWLSDAAFAAALSDASVLLFPSRLEGFGLPVLEAMRRRVPVAVAPDPALVEVAGGHAAVAGGWTADALADAVCRALAAPDDLVDRALAHAGSFTWARTVEATRQACLEACADAPRRRGGPATTPPPGPGPRRRARVRA